MVCFIYADRMLVAMGRALTDREYYATRFDVIVDPAFQGRTFGTKVMDRLLAPLKGLRFVHLTSTPGEEPFYRKLGFRKQRTALVIMDDPESSLGRMILE